MFFCHHIVYPTLLTYKCLYIYIYITLPCTYYFSLRLGPLLWDSRLPCFVLQGELQCALSLSL